MKRILAIAISFCMTAFVFGGNVEKIFSFSQVSIVQKGNYRVITLDNTMPAGLQGEPMLPYRQVALMLPPGEKAVSMQIIGEELTNVPGSFELFPQQPMQPISKGPDGRFLKNEAIYSADVSYPANPAGNLINSCLNGYSFALSTFTPVVINPAKKTVSYYRKVTVRIVTEPDDQATTALNNLTASADALKRVRLFVQNPEMISAYPVKSTLKTDYDILIITPSQFQNGFQDLVTSYAGRGMTSQIATTETIQANITGQDLPEKIRNYIIAEYQNNGIGQVILGGDNELVPHRGLYCYVNSAGTPYIDNDIPADIYFSALDGNWNTDGDEKWGEPGEDDLLPELSVGRMSFSNTSEQSNMVHKSVYYQLYPVTEEMKKPFLVSEPLYSNPVTYGSDYLELLVDEHSDNGYFTYGIPSSVNSITRLYDTTGYDWNTSDLLMYINAGKSFIHHSGHSNVDYMMRLNNGNVTNQNFTNINGVTHNYQLMYTHGCICGAFDASDCIAERSTAIANWLAGGVFNSRYGWFDQGLTEGPSAHLHREFISALYHPNPDSAMRELGAAHTMSKIKTAPWVGLPGEFEPGAQRWCHYDCNVLGDPAIKVWIDNPTVGMGETDQPFACSLSPNPCRDQVTLTYEIKDHTGVRMTLLNSVGQQVHAASYPDEPSGSHSAVINLGGLPNGIYFCRLETENTSMVKKLIVSK
jgi:hypothetical protein